MKERKNPTTLSTRTAQTAILFLPRYVTKARYLPGIVHTSLVEKRKIRHVFVIISFTINFNLRHCLFWQLAALRIGASTYGQRSMSRWGRGRFGTLLVSTQRQANYVCRTNRQAAGLVGSSCVRPHESLGAVLENGFSFTASSPPPFSQHLLPGRCRVLRSSLLPDRGVGVSYGNREKRGREEGGEGGSRPKLCSLSLSA